MDNKLDIEAILTQMISKNEIIEIARESKFIQRKTGKINPCNFLFTLMFRVSASMPASLELLVMFLNETVSKVALHKRFNKFSVIFFRKILQKIVFKRILKDQRLTINGLDDFKNIFIVDSSSWDISEHFKLIFPGCGGAASDANCKLQFCYDYLTGEIHIYDEKAGASPDQGFSINLLKIINIKSLFLFDLGYWNFETFYGIDINKGYFLSRLSNNIKLYIKDNDQYIEVKIEDVFDNIEDDNISIDEIYLHKKGKYLKVRLVGLKLPDEKANLNKMNLWRNASKRKSKLPPSKTSKPKRKSLILAGFSIYVTNASEELIDDKMLRTCYRLRWHIELIFKSFKSVLQIHKSNAISNESRLLCELYARLILVVLVHRIHFVIDNYMWSKDKKELSLDKFWKYIDAEKAELGKLIMKGIKYFLNHIAKLKNKIIVSCEKCHQKSRKTTREMIEQEIGDSKIIKISKILCLKYKKVS